MENFEIRTYGRTELALCYFPDLNPQVAYRKLQYWIDYYPHLREQLEKMGSGLSCRTYMPAQVQLIVGAIGEPRKGIVMECGQIKRMASPIA